MATQEIKHLISWKDWTDEEIQRVLHLAKKVKEEPLRFHGAMAAKTLVMLFQKTSTRTRVSFEAGFTEMGGHAIFLDWNTTNFKLTEIGYESAYLSTNCHAMMARMKRHEDLLELRDWATVPLINGCCNRYHPCQAMSDMLTILMDRGSVQGAKLTYLGVHNNVVNSLMALCAALDVHLTLVCPLVPENIVDQDLRDRILAKGLLTETLDKERAVANADYVYTDTWIDMEFFDNPKFHAMKEERINLMIPYQVNSKLLKDSKAKIMHDMPIHPGYEITHELVTHPNSIIFEQSSNRLPAQKAILLTLLNEI